MHNRFSTIIVLFGLLVFGPAMATNSSEYDIVINGARVIDPETGMDSVSNIAINGNIIAKIAADELIGKLEIDASGLVAAPGFIDLHVHGQDPYSEKIGVLDGRTSQLDLEAGAIPVSAYYEYKAGKSLTNYGASVGHAFARTLVLIWITRILPG